MHVFSELHACAHVLFNGAASPVDCNAAEWARGAWHHWAWVGRNPPVWVSLT